LSTREAGTFPARRERANNEEKHIMGKSLFAASILALTVAIAPACATKGFVRTEVGGVNSKVDTLSGTVEQTQQRVGQNEARIGAVDQKAEAAGQAAADARSAAADARTAADAAAANASAVGGRVDEVVAASRRLVYEVTLSEDQGNFRFGRTDLPDEAKSRLDQVVDQLKANPQGIYIEIEGHTDNVGAATLNERLGLERAESVKRYLYEQHQVPLHKINVISYGEDKPVAPNNTRAGRAQNRRVVVKVLS
jgi:peptidoglycan-associated lipoprotein